VEALIVIIVIVVLAAAGHHGRKYHRRRRSGFTVRESLPGPLGTWISVSKRFGGDR
jgi:hypothetical protein